MLGRESWPENASSQDHCLCRHFHGRIRVLQQHQEQPVKCRGLGQPESTPTSKHRKTRTEAAATEHMTAKQTETKKKKQLSYSQAAQAVRHNDELHNLVRRQCCSCSRSALQRSQLNRHAHSLASSSSTVSTCCRRRVTIISSNITSVQNQDAVPVH